MNDTLLLVDDEINVLKSLERLFVNSDINVVTATNAEDALKILKNFQVSVIVSDNRMPGISGIEFLSRAKSISPDSVRILLTGSPDAEAAIDAINKGEVYRFIKKPWDVEEFMDIVFDAVNRYRLAITLKKADEPTLLSLAQTIELKDPYTRGHCDRVAQYAIRIADALGLSKEKKLQIKYGSWLHDCGKIGVPEAVLNFNGRLSPEQMDIIKKHCRWGADVARLAQLPEDVINIILYHHEKYDGSGYPYGLKEDEIPLESRIVAIADMYDALTSDRPYRKKMEHKQAMEIMLNHERHSFDPEILEIFIKLFEVTNADIAQKFI